MWPFSLLPIPPLPPLPPERTWYPHICKLDPYNPTIDKYWYIPHNGVSIDSAPSPVQGLAARLVMWLSAVLPVSRDTQSTLDRVVAWLVPSTVPRAATTYELDACMYVFKPAGPIYTHPTFLWIIQVALTIIALYYLLDVVDKLCNVVVAFIAQSDDSEDKDAMAKTRHIAPAVATAPDHDAWPPSSASPAEDSAPWLEQDSPPSLEQFVAPSLAQDSTPSSSPSPPPSPSSLPAPDTSSATTVQSQTRKRRRSPSPDVQQSRHRSWFRSPPPLSSPPPSGSESPPPALLPVSLYSFPGPSSPSPSPPPTYSPAPQQTQASIADLLAAWDASSHAQTVARSTTPNSTRSRSPPASLEGRLPLRSRSLPRSAREVKDLREPVTDAAWLCKGLDLARGVEAHGYEPIVAQPALVGGNTEACDGVEAPDAPPSQPNAAPLEPNDGRDAHSPIQIVAIDVTTIPLPDSADDDLEAVTTPSSASSALEPVTPSIVASAPASNSSPVLPLADDGKLLSVTAVEQEPAKAVQSTTVLVAVVDPPASVVENNPLVDPDTFWTLDDGDADAASSSSPSGAKTPEVRSMDQVLPVVRRSIHQTLPGDPDPDPDPIPAPKPQQKQQSQSNKKNPAQQSRKGLPAARGRGRGQQHVTPDRSAPPLVHPQQPSLTPGAGPSTLSSPPPPPPRGPGLAQGQREMNQHTAHPNLPMHDGPVNQADHAGPSAKSKFDDARSRNSRRAQQPHHVSAFDTPETYTVPSTTSNASDSQNQAAKSGGRRRKR